jgi:hypothetical protein
VGKKKLLDRAADALRDFGLDQQNTGHVVEVMWQFILFHGKRHPQEMGIGEVDQFLASEMFCQRDGPENRAHAQWALQFLYEQVLQRRWPRRGRDRRGARQQRPKAVFVNGTRPGVKLLDRMRQALRVGQYALDTEKCYVDWARQYILFHQVRYPGEMGAAQSTRFVGRLRAGARLSVE